MARNYVPAPLKEARFYCEHCGHEVPFNAAICSHCKKTFDAVKCPVCNFSGPPDKFLNGCPQCGHLATTSAIGRRRGVNVEAPRRGYRRGKKQDWLTPLLGFGSLVLLGAILYFYLNKS